MTQVGIRDFRAHLRRWIDKVRAGDEIVITERGLPVARLIGASSERTLQRLIAEGLVRPPLRPKTRAEAKGRVRARGSISDIVIEQGK